MEPGSDLYLIGMAFGALGIGLAVLIQGLRLRGLAERARAWPVGTAEITRSEVVETHSRTAGRIFEARIEYVYRADGREYTGDTVAIGGTISTSRRQDAESLCSRYFPGAKVALHYDPTQPERCCLEQGGSGWVLLSGGGALFAVIGAAILVHACA